MPQHTNSSHDRKYNFAEPRSMQEALKRKRRMEVDIMNVEFQLTDREFRRDNSGHKLSAQRYREWYARARAILIYKKAEQLFLKDWIKDRRRRLQSRDVGVYTHDDPRSLLLRTCAVLEGALRGDDSDEDLGQLCAVIDSYLNHAA